MRSNQLGRPCPDESADKNGMGNKFAHLNAWEGDGLSKSLQPVIVSVLGH